MAELECSLDELRQLISQGKELNLAENFMFGSNILIGKERILTLKDVDRMDGKVYNSLRVKEYKRADVDDSVKNEVLQLCIKILKEHIDYKGMVAEKRKAVENILCNLLPTLDYVCLRLSQVKKASKRLFIHSVNTGIKSLIVDLAWQARHNQGLQDSIRFEELLVGSLLRNLGMLKTNREVIDTKIGDLRRSGNELYRQVPNLSAQIIEGDRDKHELSENIIRVIRESFERADGSGFPNGFNKQQIYQPALIVGTCAEFDLLLAGELSQGKRSYMEINRRMMSMVEKFDRATINIIGEEFRHIRDNRG